MPSRIRTEAHDGTMKESIRNELGDVAWKYVDKYVKGPHMTMSFSKRPQTESTPEATIYFITVKIWHPKNTELFDTCRDEIISDLQARGYECGVEIINMNSNSPIVNTALMEDDAIIGLWDTLRPKIKGLVLRGPQQEWITINALRRGPMYVTQDCGFWRLPNCREVIPAKPVTILIGLSDDSNGRWPPIREEIETLCQEHGLQVVVEMHTIPNPMKVHTCDSGEKTNLPPYRGRSDIHLSPGQSICGGDSIGVENAIATVGGQLRLRNARGEAETVLMTSLLPFQDLIAKLDGSNVVRVTDTSGKEDFELTSPARADLDYWRDMNNSSVQLAKDRLGQLVLSAIVGERQMLGGRDPGRQAWKLETYDEFLKIQEGLQRVQRNLYAGKLVRASGLADKTDWVIVKAEDRKIGNVLVHNSEYRPRMGPIFAHDDGLLRPQIDIFPKDMHNLYNSDSRGRVLSKGRTSAWTTGFLTGVQAEIHVRTHMRSGEFWPAWAIVGNLPSEENERRLPTVGDDGAWVYTKASPSMRRSLNLANMFWVGQILATEPGLAYFTEAKVLVNSLKRADPDITQIEFIGEIDDIRIDVEREDL